MRSRLACGLLAASIAAPVLAQGAEESMLWVAPSAFICLEQDASYKSTPLGGAMAANPAYQHWREGEGDAVLACIAKKQLLPAPLCAALFKMDPKGDPAAVKALYAQYGDSIRQLDRIGECEK